MTLPACRSDELVGVNIARRPTACVLAALGSVDQLERQEYSTRPPRCEYALTDKGAPLYDILLVMARWGDCWLAGAAGAPVIYHHHGCGENNPCRTALRPV
jgi:hypothetical protein